MEHDIPDKDKPLEKGWKRDKYGHPKKKFGTKVKEFFKGKEKVEKERLQKEGKLNAAGDKAIEKTDVKEKVKDDGTHKIEEVKKVENEPIDKANKIDETHKVEKEIKPDGTEKIKEKHDVDDGSRAAGNKVDEHHSFKANQAADGDKKIDETHKIDQHDNGGKFNENIQVKENVDKHGQHEIDETHKIQGDNVPKQVEREHYTTGQAGGLAPQGQIGGPHIHDIHQGGPQLQGQRLHQNLSEQRPIQYTEGQQLPPASHTQIAGIQGGQPGHMLPQQGHLLHQQQPGQFMPAQQFSALPQQQKVMTHHLGDFIRAGGPKAAAAALQQSYHQMNPQLAVQGGQIPQPGAFLSQPVDAAQEIAMAQSTNLAAQNSTLHMQGGHLPAQQLNLAANQANLASMQRQVNQTAGVPYYPLGHIQGHPEHMKDGDLLNRHLDAAPTTVFRGTGPAFDPNKAPLTEEDKRLHQEHQHVQQTADQQKDAARNFTAQEQQDADKIVKKSVENKADGGKEKHVEKQEIKPDGQGGAVAKKESIHEQKGSAFAPDQKVKETEKTVQKADHVPTGTGTKEARVEERKDVQFMDRTPGHIDTPKEKK